jgi:hypothetical protein
MTSSGPIDKQRTGMIGAACGLVVSFAIIVGIAKIGGLSWSSAAGIAVVPGVAGGWYFGVILAVARHGGLADPSDGAARTVDAEDHDDQHAVDQHQHAGDAAEPMRPAA